MKKSYTLSLEKKEWNNCLHDVYDKKKKDIKVVNVFLNSSVCERNAIFKGP